jgi:tetratricopeptide (TPR) repeat protein
MKSVTAGFRSAIDRTRALRIWCKEAPALLPCGQLAAAIALILIFTSPGALAQGRNDVARRMEHAAALIRDNHLPEAEQELKEVLRLAPNDASALNLLGAIRAQQKKLDEAEALFLRAIRTDGQFAGAHMNLAYLYALKGLPEKTISELKAVLRLDPNNGDATDKLARLLLSQDRIAECISFIEQAKQSQSPPVALLVLLGDAYLKKGDADKAEGSYQVALDKRGDDADAVLGLAQVAQVKGDATTATLYLSRARRLVPNSPDTFYRFALVALTAGLYEEANTTLQAAVKLKPDDPAYFLALGTTWLKKPDLTEAEQAFRRALQLQPENARGQMYLGYTLLEQKKYHEEREWLEKSLKKDTSIPETYYYLGLISKEVNEDERAIEFFKRAIQLVPSYSFPHTALGSIYLKLKNYPLAQQELEIGVKLNPNDSTVHYNLAVLYARLKNQERAQEELNIVEKLKHSGKTQEKANDTLDQSTPNHR